MHEAIDRPDVTLTKVWTNAENTDAVLGDSESAKRSAYRYLGIAAIAFLAGCIVIPNKKDWSNISTDQMESMRCTAKVTAVLMGITDLIMLFLYGEMPKQSGIIFWDLFAVFTIVLILAILVIVKLKKRIKERRF